MTPTDSPLSAAEPAELPVPPLEQTPPSPVEKRNPFQILLGVIVKPRSTFAYIRDHSGWAWLIPLALLVGLTLISRPIAQSIQQREMEKALAEIKQQMETNGGEGEFNFVAGGPGVTVSSGAVGDANPLNGFIFSYGLPVAQALGGWLVCALALLGLSWILGGRPTPSAVFRLSAWALVPFMVRIIIVTLVMVVTQHVPAQGLSRAFQPVVASPDQVEEGSGSSAGPVRSVVTFGPGGVGEFTGPSFGNLFVDNLLANLDIYTVWGLALLVVGVTVTARLSWIKGLLVTTLYALIALSLSTLPTLITFAVSSLMGGGGPVMIGP
jgi:hypothetical protein